MATDSTFYDRNWTVLQKLKYLEQWFKTNSLDPSTITFEEETDETNKTITVTVSGTTYEGNSVTLPSITAPYLEGPQGEVGPQGEKGDAGYSLWLSSQDASGSTMYTTWLNGYTTRSVQVNDLIYSASSFSLYRVTAVSGTTLTVVYVGTTKGDQGEQGIQGVQGEQGYSGLSIYDMAAAVTTSGTTVTVDVFTVPSGFTVQVGDLVIGTDGILGQVYSISSSGNYTIRYIMNLLLSSDTYVTLTSDQTITGRKSITGGLNSANIRYGHGTFYFASLTVGTIYTEICDIALWGWFLSSPYHIIIKYSNGVFSVFNSTGVSDVLTIHYVLSEDKSVVDIYFTISTGRILYFGYSVLCNIGFTVTVSSSTTAISSEELEEVSSVWLEPSTEISQFGVGNGLAISFNSAASGAILSVDTSTVALKTDIPTVPNLYNYQVFTRMGYGATTTPSLIFSFSLNTSEQLAFSSASTATDYYLLLANYIYNHYMVDSAADVNGFGVTATGTYYSSSTTLSYMVVAVEAEDDLQMGITYISSDTSGTTGTETFLDGSLESDFIPCVIRVTETAPDGTVTYYSKTQTS